MSPKKRLKIASKGGRARAKALTAAERSEVASRAAKARWAKVKGQAAGDGAAA